MKNQKLTLEDFHIGQLVNVHSRHDDMFADFTGRVKSVGTVDVVIEDQDGDCFSCEPLQLTFSSDEVMHGDV